MRIETVPGQLAGMNSTLAAHDGVETKRFKEIIQHPLAKFSAEYKFQL